MVEFSCNGPIQHYILGSSFFDWQIVPTLTHHWSVHKVGLQMNLILKRQLWEGSPARHGHVPCSLTLLTYWLTYNSPPTQKNLTHMQYFSRLGSSSFLLSCSSVLLSCSSLFLSQDISPSTIHVFATCLFLLFVWHVRLRNHRQISMFPLLCPIGLLPWLPHIS